MYAESPSGRHVFQGYSFKSHKNPKFLDIKRAEARANKDHKAFLAHLELEAYLDAVEMIRGMDKQNMMQVAAFLADLKPKLGREFRKELDNFALLQANLILS